MKPFRIFATAFLLAASSPALATTLYSVTAVGPAGSDAFAINNLGNVVGQTPNGAVTDPFLWTPGGGLQDLGTLGGNSAARAINDNNQVVGQSNGTAFRWTAGPGIVQLDARASDASGINGSNVVIGFEGNRVIQWASNNTRMALFPTIRVQR
jgi:probable HAF family extracellular repeat protein